jgi:hypothetical protein
MANRSGDWFAQARRDLDMARLCYAKLRAFTSGHVSLLTRPRKKPRKRCILSMVRRRGATWYKGCSGIS